MFFFTRSRYFRFRCHRAPDLTRGGYAGSAAEGGVAGEIAEETLMDARVDTAIEVFSTCPPSGLGDPATYLDRAVKVARWSEVAGCKGMLVYSDDSQLDAWSVSHAIVRHTSRLCPLVAVQPIDMHPYTVAETLASIATLWQRRFYLNMVAGSFTNDLNALNDTTPHDRRYDRL